MVRLRAGDQGPVNRLRPELAHHLRGDISAANAFPGQIFKLSAGLMQHRSRHDGAAFPMYVISARLRARFAAMIRIGTLGIVLTFHRPISKITDPVERGAELGAFGLEARDLCPKLLALALVNDTNRRKLIFTHLEVRAKFIAFAVKAEAQLR